MSADFDRIARPYRWLEYMTLGWALQRCRTHYLPQVAGLTHALVLGDGDGRFLARLLAANPLLRATAVDTSAAMLSLLCRRCERAVPRAALTLHHGSALELDPAAETDLVVAHFFFDCLRQPELDSLIARFAKEIRSDALWLVSDFRIPKGLLQTPATIYVRGLYLAFGLIASLETTRLPDHEGPLQAAGLARVAQHLSLGGLLMTELWQRPSGGQL